jgi:hypothetical protein
MANPLYGQNKADTDVSVFGRGKMNVLTSTAGTLDLSADDSGAVIFLNDADGIVQLPAAEAGLQFKVIIGIDATAGCAILAASGDCFFGQIKVLSTTDDKTEVQDIDYATATGTVASYDTLDFTSNSATLAGTSGDVVELLCVDGTAWCVNATLVTVHAEPASTAIINAS